MTSDSDQCLPNHKSSHRRRTQVSNTPASKLQGLNGIILDILLLILLFSSITKGELLPSKDLSLHEIHLVRCLTHISQRYFAPGRTLVILSPSNYRDVQRVLIADIQRTSLWPVVVTVDGNISKRHATHFTDRDGSYIILIPDGNIKYIHAEMLGLNAEREKIFTRIWNSEARVVVAGANEFPISQKRDILNYFSKFRIYNCIIVSREHHILDKRYSRPIKVNDVDTGMQLGVYTWFPYQSSDRCTEVKDITLLDSWVISAQGYFAKNSDLFPGKISNNLKGCPMKAVVRDAEWDLTTHYSVEGDVTNVLGLEMDLLEIVLEGINMTFIHVPTTKGFEQFEGLTDNLIRAMLAKEAYIALGEVGTHYLIDPFLDSTNSYYTLRVRWYVPCSVKYEKWSSIYRIFSVELWLVLIISIVFAAISTTLLGRKSYTSEWESYKTVTSSLINLWAVILGVSVSRRPCAPSLRLLFLAWVCFSLAFSTVFQAFLTTFLIDSGFTTPIQNLDELYETGMKLEYPEFFNFIFEIGDETEVTKVQNNRANCGSYQICEDWAKYHKNTSILFYDLDMEVNYADGKMLGEKSEPLMCRLEDGVVYNEGLRMVMLQGDPLLGRVTEIIDRVVEAGLYNYWITQSLFDSILHYQMNAIGVQDHGYYSFKLYHLQIAFYLLLMGWCLSAICVMVELFYNRFLSKRK